MKTHLNNTDDDKRPWGNDEMMRMLMNNNENGNGRWLGHPKGMLETLGESSWTKTNWATRSIEDVEDARYYVKRGQEVYWEHWG